MTGPVLTRHRPETAPAQIDGLVRVFLEVYADRGPFYAEHRFRGQLVEQLAVPGWTLVTAGIDGELVGYAYGFTVPVDGDAWAGLRTPLPSEVTREDGTRTFAVSELMVRAPWRRRGIARALHDELLAGRPEERAGLLALPDNTAAQAAYAAWGWRRVAELRPPLPHAPLYDVLLLNLR